MLTTIANIQTLADRLKAYIQAADVHPAMKRIVLRSVTLFEAAPWIPLALEDILTEQNTGLELSADEVKFNGPVGDALDAIDNILRLYVQRVAPAKLFTKEDAAQYLGIGIDQLNSYVSRQKILRGMNIGRSIVFTQAELDTFNRHQRLRRGERRSVES